MGAILGVLGKTLSFITPSFITSAFSRFFSSSEKIEEMRAQIELLEAEAFARGRYSPKYVIRYSVAFLFLVAGIVLIITIFVPSLRTEAESALRHLGTMIELSHEAGQ
jgi:hypothetical protein